MTEQITKPTIGKDVIESLTFGMYEDSRFIFREYIQNSADQIDKAVRLGILDSIDDGQIEITIDKVERRIEFSDNATGIEQSKSVALLRNIAVSNKKRGVDKGFRGIGRLGGLAYCETLVFETSFKGEASKTIMTWDAEQLRQIINSRHEKEEAAQVIEQVTHYKTLPEEQGAHYFNVILEDVDYDELLDIESVKDYLSMVAPVPFESAFLFRGKIVDLAKEYGRALDEYRVYINNEEIKKAYRTRIYDNLGCSIDDDIFEVQTFEFKNSSSELILWGWYGVNTFKGVINQKTNLCRGFRLRKNNIQIGSESALVKLHKQERDNFYFVGEIHAIHSDLIPNARRDYFLENDCLKEMEKYLKRLFMDLNKNIVREASIIRSSHRKIETMQKLEKELHEKNELGFTDSQEKEELEDKFEKKREQAIKSQNDLDKRKRKYETTGQPLNMILKKIVSVDTTIDLEKVENPIRKQDKAKYRTDKFSSLKKSERKLISRIYRVIKTNLKPDMAKALISKIDEEIEGKKKKDDATRSPN